MKKIPVLHIVLFILTFLSTLMAGAIFFKGIDVLKEPWRIYEGLSFSITLMTILLGHELSHYFASKKHNTKATLPYFIPAPSWIGTFGAFIKMKSPIVTRRALIDIGASGPIVGFILSVIASVIGLYYSSIVQVVNAEGALSFGDSLLFSLLSRIIVGVPPESKDILLHPIASAGWIGLFVTSLNLIPIGQLDGGHVAFAFLNERHEYISRILVAILLFMGFLGLLHEINYLPAVTSHLVNRLPDFWVGWALWGGIMLVLGTKHPPVIYWEVPLDKKRKIMGLFALSHVRNLI